MRKVLLALSLVIAPGIAGAHAHLLDPSPRFDTVGTQGGIVDPNGPCGAAKPATAPHTYVMGSTITVKIGETIDHPGHYEMYWGATDATLTAVTGMLNIANPTGAQETDVTFVLPNMVMDNATLQIRQVQTNTNPPTNYYSCADIKLVAPGADLAGLAATDMAVALGDMGAPFDGQDLSASGTDDAGAAMGDMGKKSGAAGAGVPGCSMGGSPPAARGSLMLVLLAIALAPTLRLRRRSF